jgi:hypothetical protein
MNSNVLAQQSGRHGASWNYKTFKDKSAKRHGNGEGHNQALSGVNAGWAPFILRLSFA